MLLLLDDSSHCCCDVQQMDAELAAAEKKLNVRDSREISGTHILGTATTKSEGQVDAVKYAWSLLGCIGRCMHVATVHSVAAGR